MINKEILKTEKSGALLPIGFITTGRIYSICQDDIKME